MGNETLIKSTQEQAVAAWIGYLNQVRAEQLTNALGKLTEDMKDEIRRQNGYLKDAMESIHFSEEEVAKLLQSNRGGEKGIHGFIAEVAQCGIGNARQLIFGKEGPYTWINNNGPEDLFRDGVLIQQKFVNSGGKFSLNAVMEHMNKYPDFIKNGGKYQIPKDMYEKVMMYKNIPEHMANKMPTSTGEFSLADWKFVNKLFEEKGLSIDSIEASDLRYTEVQKGVINQTLNNEKIQINNTNKLRQEKIKRTAKEDRLTAMNNSKPSLNEAGKVTLVSAGIEGGTAFALAVAEKHRQGKRMNEYTEEDWKDVLGDSAIGTLKGGLRGISVYALTNAPTPVPSAIANAMVTASFGIADQVYQYRNGNVNEVQLIENSELLCLEVAVSALSATVGQILIPVPILGAIIGNAVGTLMYQTAKNSFNESELKFFEEYKLDQMKLDAALGEQYDSYIKMLDEEFTLFISIIEHAFSPDYGVALNGSIELAKRYGVPSSEILDTKEKIDDYFLL